MSTRRSFATAITAGALAGCARAETDRVRLHARPSTAITGLEPGLHTLKLRKERDSLLYIPKSANLDKPAPLLVFLHGAGGSEQHGIDWLTSFADDFAFLLLSPASQGSTWDAIQDGYGPDVRLIDQALTSVFAALPVDARRIGVCGFSDGASYALGLGLSNGDLFGSVLAFSPGFIPPGSQSNGQPRIFVSHGRNDTVLPIASCSRRIVPGLTQAGYNVTYREFEGPHTVPREIMQEATRLFVG